MKKTGKKAVTVTYKIKIKGKEVIDLAAREQEYIDKAVDEINQIIDNLGVKKDTNAKLFAYFLFAHNHSDKSVKCYSWAEEMYNNGYNKLKWSDESNLDVLNEWEAKIMNALGIKVKIATDKHDGVTDDAVQISFAGKKFFINVRNGALVEHFGFRDGDVLTLYKYDNEIRYSKSSAEVTYYKNDYEDFEENNEEYLALIDELEEANVKPFYHYWKEEYMFNEGTKEKYLEFLQKFDNLYRSKFPLLELKPSDGKVEYSYNHYRYTDESLAKYRYLDGYDEKGKQIKLYYNQHDIKVLHYYDEEVEKPEDFSKYAISKPGQI